MPTRLFVIGEEVAAVVDGGVVEDMTEDFFSADLAGDASAEGGRLLFFEGGSKMSPDSATADPSGISFLVSASAGGVPPSSSCETFLKNWSFSRAYKMMIN